MNIQHYTASFDQAMWGLVNALGWRALPAPQRTGFADVSHVTQFKSELGQGIPFCIDSMPVKTGRTSFVSGHRLYNLVTGELAAEMEMTSVHFDLEGRTAIPIPVMLKEAAAEQWSWRGDEQGNS